MNETKFSLKKKRVRSLFLAIEKKGKTSDDLENELLTKGMAYIQMKLPVEKITPEFEAEISQKVEKNILKAKIREASEKDLQDVANLHNKSWMTSCTPYTPISVQSLKTIFDYPDTVFLIASVYGVDGGFAILDLEGPNKEFGIIVGLGVIPRFQRKGLGTVIGMAAWNHFKKIGIKELRCEVYSENKRSYDFIKSLGFED
jgi:ribosomal protein S18 acetylase RimI-like enzyme